MGQSPVLPDPLLRRKVFVGCSPRMMIFAATIVACTPTPGIALDSKKVRRDLDALRKQLTSVRVSGTITIKRNAASSVPGPPGLDPLFTEYFWARKDSKICYHFANKSASWDGFIGRYRLGKNNQLQLSHVSLPFISSMGMDPVDLGYYVDLRYFGANRSQSRITLSELMRRVRLGILPVGARLKFSWSHVFETRRIDTVVLVNPSRSYLCEEVVQTYVRTKEKPEFRRVSKVQNSKLVNGLWIPTELLISAGQTAFWKDRSITEVRISNLSGQIEDSVFSIFRPGERTVSPSGESFVVSTEGRLKGIASNNAGSKWVWSVILTSFAIALGGWLALRTSKQAREKQGTKS